MRWPVFIHLFLLFRLVENLGQFITAKDSGSAFSRKSKKKAAFVDCIWRSLWIGTAFTRRNWPSNAASEGCRPWIGTQPLYALFSFLHFRTSPYLLSYLWEHCYTGSLLSLQKCLVDYKRHPTSHKHGVAHGWIFNFGWTVSLIQSPPKNLPHACCMVDIVKKKIF